MLDLETYGDFETAWCPGCGNHNLLKALKQALAMSDIAPEKLLMVGGIGQAAKTPQYLRANAFCGLHGRGVPAATGARLANRELKIVCTSGDGCNYGEGGNHFLAALRRNIDLTLIVHDNQVYGLTKGQASPTSLMGFVTKTQPEGVWAAPFQPLATAVLHRVSFVARGFTGEVDHLAGLIQEALTVDGLALLDVLQPCVSFNKVNTFKWYKERVYHLGEDHDPTDFGAALAKAQEFGDQIPLGVLWRGERTGFSKHFNALDAGPLYGQGVDRAAFEHLLEKYF
ncbi:MAG: thiamine pyrophosphate-dependent enzyme [Pseudomonadota bacterium]